MENITEINSQNQSYSTIVRRFKSINNNPHCEQIMLTKHNYRDLDNSIVHHHEIDDQQLLELLSDIREAAKRVKKKVTYKIVDEEYICFKTFMKDRGLHQQDNIYDMSMVPIIEFVFDIKLGKDAKVLNKLDKKSFVARSTKMLKPDEQAYTPTIIYVKDYKRNLTICTEDLETYQLGMGHICHALNLFPEAIWLTDKVVPEKGHFYKELSVMNGLTVVLKLYMVDGGLYLQDNSNLSCEYYFSLISIKALGTKVKHYLESSPNAENEELLRALNPLNRSNRISEIFGS